jgi:cobyrinic acid a,c-diamide synthase
MAALHARGLAVSGFKVGPDFVDPGYHTLATGRPGRNLDPFLTDERLVEPLLLHGATASGSTDVAVIDGVMGLFDGRLGGEGFASTAHVATLTRTPVVVVVDVGHMSRTAAAVVHGLATFDPTVRVAGVVLNKAASGRHMREAWSALDATGVRVLGVLPRDADLEAPYGRPGLVPATEREEAARYVDLLAARVGDHVDLDAVLAIARSAPDPARGAWDPAAALGSAAPADGPRPVVAVAGGRAFAFRYAETEELMYAAGLTPVEFDPLSDPALPRGTAGIYLGGGLPEAHADELAANHSLRQEIRLAISSGIPTVAECAGLLYLCDSIDGSPAVGAIPAVAATSPRLTLGYRTAVAKGDSILALAGTGVTGHELHRTAITVDAGEDLPATWLLDGHADGFALDPAGTGRATLHASYLHTHWAGHPQLAARFAASVHDHAGTSGSQPDPEPAAMSVVPAVGAPG